MINRKTITILPETSDTVLCVTFSGTVTAEDYMEYFEKPLEAIYAAKGHVSALIHFDTDFSGWTQDAADLSFKCISTYAPMARKIAYISAPDSRKLLMRMIEPITAGETRFFESGQLQDAITWIKEEK